MARVDLWFSLVLITVGVGAGYEAWRMPRLTELGVHPMTVPGLTPGVIAAIIVLLGIVLLLRSLRSLTSIRPVDAAPAAVARPESAATSGLDDAARADAAGGWHRVGITLALTLGYAGVLVGRMPFWLATACFVFAFVLLFEAHGGRGWPARIGTALGLAAAVALSVTWVFESVFLVRLP